MLSRYLRTLACSALIASPAMAASVVTNGSFELPYVPGSFETTPPASDIPGWTISSGTVDHIGNYWQAQDGTQSIDMDGINPATIYQDVPTTAGTPYILSFYMAGNPDGQPVIKNLEVSWGGNVLDTPSFDTTGMSHSDMGWTQFSYYVVGNAGTTRLEFKSVESNDYPGTYGAALDNVRVDSAIGEGAAVPLPAAAPAGLALLGGLAAWRRRQAAR